jgi:hypothetical protein
MLGKPSKKEAHTRHVSVVFAGLIGAPKEDLVDLTRVDSRSSRRLRDHNRAQIIWPHRSKAPLEPTDGSTNSFYDHDRIHVDPPRKTAL